MSPVIRISKANWDRLKLFAVPLEDSIDDALEKVLNTAESSSGQAMPNNPDARQQPRDEVQKPTCQKDWDIENENRLLLQFEQWLNKIGPRVRLLHRKKTMATWTLEKSDGGMLKLFVPTNGLNKLYLPLADYTAIDKQSKIVHKNYYDNKTGRAVGWNYYPQFNIKTSDDLEFAKRLVKFILEMDNEQGSRFISEKRRNMLAHLKKRYQTIPQSISLADELIRERRAEARQDQAE